MLDYRPIDVEYVVLLNYIGPETNFEKYAEQWNVINISTKEENIILNLFPGEDKVMHEASDYT